MVDRLPRRAFACRVAFSAGPFGSEKGVSSCSVFVREGVFCRRRVGAGEEEVARAFSEAPKLKDGRADVKSGLNGIYGNADLARGQDGKMKTFMQYREVIGTACGKGIRSARCGRT